MHGVSGSGKSTVAQEIANLRGAVILKADAIRKHLTNTPLTKSDADIYDAVTSDLVYSFLEQTSFEISQSGMDVLLDATFLDVTKRTQVLRSLKQRGLQVNILSVECSEETAKKRIEARVGDVSDATNKILQIQLEKFVPISEEEQEFIIPIWNNGELDVSKINLD